MSASGIVAKWSKAAIDAWLSGKTLKLLVVDSNDAANLDSVQYVADVDANEVVGTGYARATLANVTSYAATNGHKSYVDADDVEFVGLDLGATQMGAAYIFADTGNDATSELVARLNLGDATSTGSNFLIRLSATDGFVALD